MAFSSKNSRKNSINSNNKELSSSELFYLTRDLFRRNKDFILKRRSTTDDINKSHISNNKPSSK